MLAALSEDNLKVVKLCLATRARWSEAATLRREDVLASRVTYINTKNGKNCTVPISAELCQEITNGVNRGRLFRDLDYMLVRDVIKSVAPDLPAGQSVHVFRHTFVSHFMISGGNILALQKNLGPSQHSVDNDLCPLRTGLPERCCSLQPAGKSATCRMTKCPQIAPNRVVTGLLM